MLDLDDSKVSSFALLINAVLIFAMFYLAGAIGAIHRNKLLDRKKKDSIDE